MARGGEVQGQYPGSGGSEDLDQLKCQPCLEDGNLREAVGMCVDCQDYLCKKCFKIHTRPKPMRNHQLLNKEHMLQSQIRPSAKDVCTERCSVHEYKVIEYYCTTHSQLGCTVCITLGHAICKGVQYIPHEAKDLANNEEYTQAESHLKSVLNAFEKVAENVQKNAEELETTCKEALEKIKDYRRKFEESFDKIEAKLVEQAKAIKSKEMKELATIGDKYKQAHEEVQSVLEKIETLQKFKLNCSVYTEMMRTKDKLKYMDAKIKGTDVDKSYSECQIKFYPNKETLDLLQNTETLGIISGSDKRDTINRCNNPICSAKHARDINVKTGTDKATCGITGLAVLPDGKLVLADRNTSKIKTVNVQSGQVLAELKLSSAPWDVADLNNNKVAVTLSYEKKLAIVTVGDLSIERYLTVSGLCYGVDYRNGKLAVSLCNPDEVQILNLQGTVLYTISTDMQGRALFKGPEYLTFDLDETALYVSNWGSNNVVCVKLDGTIVATYTDSDLKYPEKLVIDNHGHVYVCSQDSHQVHQISKDCKKIRMLLTQAVGLSQPYSICLSKEEDKLYVGMYNNDNVKMFTTERRIQ